jgi:uncharacterized membrane protein YdbT with pleckstrin-like domain
MARSFNPYPIVRCVKILAIAVMLTAGIYMLHEYVERIWGTLLAAVWLISLASAMLAYLSAKFHTLTLDETSMVYQSGVLSTRRIVIPYAKVTEASYTQGLVQRLFGVGTLNVDTAGGSNVAIHVQDVRHVHLVGILEEIRKKGGKGDGV